jgi:hypothetical protein
MLGGKKGKRKEQVLTGLESRGEEIKFFYDSNQITRLR